MCLKRGSPNDAFYAIRPFLSRAITQSDALCPFCVSQALLIQSGKWYTMLAPHLCFNGADRGFIPGLPN